MFPASPSDQPAIVGDGRSEPVARRFGHLRQAAATTADPAIVEPLQQGVLPVDSTKTFVGPNGTYYDERWRWMEWRGRSRSWNWSAALTFGGWLAYRRFYGFAALYLGWLGLLLALALNGARLGLLAVPALVVAVIVGLYANTLYRFRFRRMSWQVAEQQDDHPARLKALAEAGGVDRRAVGLMALAGAALGGLLIALDG